MQWILLLIQMNASVADLHYVELYETLEQCTADLQEISPRLEPHEVMLCRGPGASRRKSRFAE
jgi:hypothetical protein